VLGTPKLFSSLFTAQVREGDIRTQAKTAGGALFDMGVYPINAARNLFRDEPIELMALIPASGDQRFAQVDETSSLLLRFPGGEIAQLTASLGITPQSSYRVLGSLGELRVEPAFDYHGDTVHHLTVEGHTTRRVYARGDQFAPELIYFSRCILEDTEPEPSGEEGLADVRVCEAALESARTGRAQPLPAFPRSARPELRMAMHKPPVRAARTVHAPSPMQK
jgi:predicted dehydrogenase